MVLKDRELTFKTQLSVSGIELSVANVMVYWINRIIESLIHKFYYDIK